MSTVLKNDNFQFNSLFNEIKKYYEIEFEKVMPEFLLPKELEKHVDCDPLVTFNSHEEYLKQLEKIIQYSIKTHHKFFLNQLFVGTDPYMAMSDLLTSMLNTQMHIYEVAPVFSVMEQKILARVLELFEMDPISSDAVFCPGGSFSNFQAIHVARFRIVPGINKTGLYGFGKILRIYASMDSHYSLKKGVQFLGMGSDSLALVKVEPATGKMDLKDLEEKIQEDLQSSQYLPMLVVAIAGTTVLGCFDDIQKVSEICKKYHLFFHVDAVLGGTVVFSKKYRDMYLHGMGNADSISWNPHKALRCSSQCSILMVKNRKALADCNSVSNVSYLFKDDNDRLYPRDLDFGNKYLQCGRKVDVLKLWTVWKVRGERKMGEQVEHIIGLAQYFKEQIKKRPQHFKLVMEHFESFAVGFWVSPFHFGEQKIVMNGSDADKKGKKEKITTPSLHEVAILIKKEMMIHDGRLMISYQPLSSLGFCNFFRIVILSPELTEQDMDQVLDMMEGYSKKVAENFNRGEN